MEFKVILSDYFNLFLIALRERVFIFFFFFIPSFSWTRLFRFYATFKRTFTPSITMTVNKALFFSAHATNFYRCVCFISLAREFEIRYFIYIEYIYIYIGAFMENSRYAKICKIIGTIFNMIIVIWWFKEWNISIPFPSRFLFCENLHT